MQTRRTARGAVRDRIDAPDQAIMARLSAESSPVLDRFLPALSRSAGFFALWIGIAAALPAGKDERGRRAALRGPGQRGDREHGQQRPRQGPAAQRGQRLLVAFLDDPAGFSVDQLSGGRRHAVHARFLASRGKHRHRPDGR